MTDVLVSSKNRAGKTPQMVWRSGNRRRQVTGSEKGSPRNAEKAKKERRTKNGRFEKKKQKFVLAKWKVLKGRKQIWSKNGQIWKHEKWKV